jgi:hypothetical protein
MNKLGALWIHEKKDGKRFMAGTIEIDKKKTQLIVFMNNYKDPEDEKDKNKPDMIIYESEDQGEDGEKKPVKKVENDLPF